MNSSSPDHHIGQEQIKILDLPISIIELSARTRNCLESESIRSINQLIQMSDHELLRIRNFGRTSLNEIDEKLKYLGLKRGERISIHVKDLTQLKRDNDALRAENERLSKSVQALAKLHSPQLKDLKRCMKELHRIATYGSSALCHLIELSELEDRP